MSDFVKPIIQIGATIIGSILGGPIGAMIGTLIGAVVSNALFKPPQQERQAAETTLRLGEGGRRYLFGRCATAGGLADAFNYGGKYGTDREVLVIDIADHRCDALEGFYVDDAYHAFAGDGVVAGFSNQLRVWWLPGTENQTVPAVLTANGGWSANDRARGCARVVVEYTADKSDAKNPVWPSGRPQFLFVVRGARLYDPRKDSTVPGGSGTHRWADPSTREWSENAELCRYNFDRGIYACDRVAQPEMLLIGRGLSELEAPPQAIFTAANLCDEDVALAAGGTEKRYRASGVVEATEEFGTVTEAFAAAMGGVVIQREGAIGVEPGHAKNPVATLTDADVIVGTALRFSMQRGEADREWCNTVPARYVEPSQKWSDHSAPVRRNSADVIADGGSREEPLQLRFVTSGTQAQRIAEIKRRMGRLQKTGGLTVGPRHIELEAGDWINFLSVRRPERSGTYRIDSDAQGQDWRNALTLRQIASSVFPWSSADEIADGATAEAQTPPDFYAAPDAEDWALTGGNVGTGLPGLRFAGVVTDQYATGVRFEYRVYDPEAGPDDNWIAAELAAPSVTSRDITSVQPEIEYEGAVSYQFAGGILGDRLILGPVTTGVLTISAAEQLLIQNSFPVGFTIESNDTGSDTANIVIGAHTRRYPDKDVAVAGATLSGLANATVYWVYYDDPTRSAGAPAYETTTEGAEAFLSADNPARHYVGQITTQVAGGSGSVGGGGGTPPGGGGMLESSV